MAEYGLFNDESADWTEDEAVEAGFYSREEAEAAIRDRYDGDDDLVVHEVEEPDDEDDVEAAAEALAAVGITVRASGQPHGAVPGLSYVRGDRLLAAAGSAGGLSFDGGVQSEEESVIRAHCRAYYTWWRSR